MVSLRSLVRSLLLLCLVLALTGCGSGDGPVSSDAGEAPASGKPSAAGAAAQATVAASGPTTLTVKEGLSVVVPEGAAPAGAALVVQPVEAAEPHAFSGLTALGSFDVTLGDLSAFEQPLELRFGYDPAALREDIDPAAQLTVGYLDEPTGRWVETDAMVDTAAAQVVVSTDHLTLWSLFGLDDDTVHSFHPNFDIYFREDLNAPPLSANPSGDAIYDFVAEVRGALVTAHQAYGDSTGAALKVPAKSKVYIDDWGADKTAEWGWFSKNIEIPVTYITLQELQHDAAHELFHAVQNEYYNVGGMVDSRWWMEATADYAAASIGTGHGLTGRLPLKFLTMPLDSDDTEHMYQVAYFVDYMARQGVAFPALFKAVAASDKDILLAIGDYMAESGRSLPALYDQFAYDMLFLGGVPREAVTGHLADAMGQLHVEYTDPTVPVAQEINVAGPYATALAAYTVKTGTDDTYTVALSAIEPTAGVLTRFVIGGPLGVGDVLNSGVLEPGVQVPVDIQDGQTIYFVVTNSADKGGYVTAVIGVQEGEHSFEHSRTAPMYNDEYTAEVAFTLESSHAFEVVEEITQRRGENWMLHVRLIEPVNESKPATFTATAEVTGLAFADPDNNAGRTPHIVESYWNAPDKVNTDEVTVTTTGQDADSMRLSYEVVLGYTNQDGDDYQTGGASLVYVIIDY